jgi:hypothetical protein
MEDDELLENRDQIAEHLKQLGFLNAESILRTASTSGIYGTDAGPALECCDFTSDPDRIEYSFWLAQDKSDAGWHIKAIWAYVELPGAIDTDTGFVIVGSTYNIGDGPLPTRDQIRADVGNKVKEREIEERRSLDRANEIHLAILNPTINHDRGRTVPKKQ